MSTAALTGVGLQLKRGDGASNETFTAIAELASWDGPDMTREIIDVTAQTDANRYKTFLPGFRDPGEVSATFGFTRDGYIDMLTDFDSNSTVNYQLVYADTGATTIDFTGFVTNIGQAAPMEDKIEMTVTFKITGQITVSS